MFVFHVDLTCDKCSAGVVDLVLQKDATFGLLTVARDQAIQRGWHSAIHNGKWEHRCPHCTGTLPLIQQPEVATQGHP